MRAPAGSFGSLVAAAAQLSTPNAQMTAIVCIVYIVQVFIIRRVGVSEWAPALRRVLSQECPALALARIRVEWSMEGVQLRGSSWGGSASSAGCTGSGGTLTLATTHEPHGH